MFRSAPGRTEPPSNTRIVPVCSTMNRRPVPSCALVISTGFDRPLAIGVRSIVDGEGAASVMPPSVSGFAPTTADARAGSRPTRRADRISAPAAARIKAERGARAMGMVIGSSLRRVGRRGPERVRRWGNPALNRPEASSRGRILGGVTSVFSRTYGAQSMTAPLREVLVKAPGPAFGAAFDVPGAGFLRPVDLDLARRQHDGLVSVLERLGVAVRVL